MRHSVLVDNGPPQAQVVALAALLPALLDVLYAGLEAWNEMPVASRDVCAVDNLACTRRDAVARAAVEREYESASVSGFLLP